MMPRRVQRKRISGWRKPAGAVYVGRGSKWGNPFRAGKKVTLTGDMNANMKAHATFKADDHARAVALYKTWITDGLVEPIFGTRFQPLDISPELIRAELRGKDLMCWCPLDQPCHADVLLEIANKEKQ